jgi:retinoblastoma-like protein 1
VLEKLELPAFDMSKLVGTFVRHISPPEQVPRELKRHLFSIEEKILEQLAWERGSSLYPMLIAACSLAVPPASPRLPDTVIDESPAVVSRKVSIHHAHFLHNSVFLFHW